MDTGPGIRSKAAVEHCTCIRPFTMCTDGLGIRRTGCVLEPGASRTYMDPPRATAQEASHSPKENATGRAVPRSVDEISVHAGRRLGPVRATLPGRMIRPSCIIKTKPTWEVYPPVVPVLWVPSPLARNPRSTGSGRLEPSGQYHSGPPHGRSKGSVVPAGQYHPSLPAAEKRKFSGGNTAGVFASEGKGGQTRVVHVHAWRRGRGTWKEERRRPTSARILETSTLRAPRARQKKQPAELGGRGSNERSVPLYPGLT